MLVFLSFASVCGLSIDEGSPVNGFGTHEK